jgi:radical SAM superfamily enzyme YgiQ (UPF0313 family)
MTANKIVYMNEFNVRMGRATYLPLVSGILRAYAETNPRVKANFKFKPFLFCIDRFENIIGQYDEMPDMVTFSISMWNEQLSLHLAREIKARWPDCLIVFGGAQLPHNSTEYLKEHTFIDVGVSAEGEEAFFQICDRFLDSRDFSGINNVTFRKPVTSEIVTSAEHSDFDRDLDSYPSPYLAGLFDDMFEKHPEYDFQAIIETNRGCPFLCTFCYWGRGGTTRRYRYHSLDRVRGEIDWAARNGIRYMFNADSNFGMHKRDGEIVDMLIESKKKYGYPEKFRTCWGKNTDDKIFMLAAKLHKYEMEKGITLARQSNSKPVLANIKRGNIKLESYAALQRRFNDLDVPVYTEMILGLPGETYGSWRDGIQQILDAGLKNQLFVYQCEVYPNTEMGDPEYQRRFGIQTKRTELREIHGIIRDKKWIAEYQDVIVSTDSMTNNDWRRMTKLATLTMLLHSMKLGFYALGWLSERFGLPHVGLIEFLSEQRMRSDSAPLIRGELAYIDGYLDNMMNGAGRGCVVPGYLDIYWDIEEALFIRVCERLDDFYREFESVVRQYLDHEGMAYSPVEVSEVIRYQRLRIPQFNNSGSRTETFTMNVPEYFDHLFNTKAIPLVRERQTMVTNPVDYNGDQGRFVRETILWGRKSGTLMVKCTWQSQERLESSSDVVASARAERAKVILDNWPVSFSANMAQ